MTAVDPEASLADKFEMIQNFFSKMAGGSYVGFQNSVFLSERDTADRNFALAYFMRENKCFPRCSNSFKLILTMACSIRRCLDQRAMTATSTPS